MGTWTVEITIFDEATQTANVRAVRVDSATDEKFVYECRAIISTPEQRSALLQRIKDKFIEDEARQGRIENILAGLADTATNALNNWEATNG